ncbi:MAG TPA: hypothetical protein VEU08_19590 [Vicinamibacterales bacterium]|nr:hypothetical protein [Vicinamibacterales bacterium]
MDLNPGIAPSGLFWTTRLAESNVSGVNPGAGNAVYRANDVRVFDFHDIGNALFGGGPAQTPAIVSFEVRWSGVQDRVHINNPADGFAGEYVRGSAQMAWTATVGELQYVSGPMSASSSEFAELGTERNGAFYPHP